MQLFSGLRRDEPIEIQWRPPQLQIEEDAYRMGQDFTDQAMLKMPEVMDTNAGDGKALGRFFGLRFYWSWEYFIFLHFYLLIIAGLF